MGKTRIGIRYQMAVEMSRPQHTMCGSRAKTAHHPAKTLSLTPRIMSSHPTTCFCNLQPTAPSSATSWSTGYGLWDGRVSDVARSRSSNTVAPRAELIRRECRTAHRVSPIDGQSKGNHQEGHSSRRPQHRHHLRLGGLGQGGPEIDRLRFSFDSIFIFLRIWVAPKPSPAYQFPLEGD
jgi:hypothetical protein